MKKLILATFLLTLITIQGYGQKQCDIINHYEDFISIEKSTYNEKVYLTTRVVEAQRKSCFSELVNNNIMFFQYLLKNFSSNTNHQSPLELTDSIAIRNKYFIDIKKDSLF